MHGQQRGVTWGGNRSAWCREKGGERQAKMRHGRHGRLNERFGASESALGRATKMVAEEEEASAGRI
jgi:hypothetical protein